MMRNSTLLVLLLSHFSVFAQIQIEKNYKDNIATIQFGTSVVRSYPIIFPNSSIFLSFDDFDGGVKNYFYKVQHCTQDWAISNLVSLDYLEGYETDRIRDYDFSFNTQISYTHYTLQLPNDYTRFTKSGNYLLTIYEEDSPDEPVFTRRFLVSEEANVALSGEVLSASNVSKMRSFQEVDFIVHHKNFKIPNAQRDVKATVLQNGNWHTAKLNIKPQFVREGLIEFDLQDEVVFAGGKEFRRFDLRSLQYGHNRVEYVKRLDKGFVAKVDRDESRSSQAHFFDQDLNGRYVIANEQEENDDIESDYVQVGFELEAAYPFEGVDVFVVGKFSDWEAKFPMVYDEHTKAYMTSVLLKQGYYNYHYALKAKDENFLDYSETEGNSSDTENEYLVVIYYRPFGERYDRILKTGVFKR